MVEALVVSGIDFHYPDDMQPEDYFTSIMETDEMYKRKDRMYSWAKNYRPAEIHMMLEWAANNKLVGKNAVRFSTEYPLQLLCYDIAVRARPCVVSGTFTPTGHIVVLVGLRTLQDDIEQVTEPRYVKLSAIKQFIVDDPYGNWYTDYQDHNGNDIVFEFGDFNKLTKSAGDTEKKWAHRIVV
jgi:hypothetical protein